jgi:hypothetical protein
MVRLYEQQVGCHVLWRHGPAGYHLLVL